jgi:hypothetical protein
VISTGIYALASHPESTARSNAVSEEEAKNNVGSLLYLANIVDHFQPLF